MVGPFSPDLSGFHPDTAHHPRGFERESIRRFPPFSFRGRNVGVAEESPIRVGVITGRLGPEKSPIHLQDSNAVFSAYDASSPSKVFGETYGILRQHPTGEGDVFTPTWTQRHHPKRGVLRAMFINLITTGALREINSDHQDITPDAQQSYEGLVQEANTPNAPFGIEVKRDENGRLTHFRMFPTTT